MGGWPEEEGQQGAGQDEEPIQPRGVARVEASEEVGGHGCLQEYHLRSQAWGAPLEPP